MQAALVCFADGRVTSDTSALGKEGVLAVNRGNPFRLNGDSPVWLSATMRYEVVKASGRQGPFKVSTRGWIYHLHGERRRRLIGYHWHPVSPSHTERSSPWAPPGASVPPTRAESATLCPPWAEPEPSVGRGTQA